MSKPTEVRNRFQAVKNPVAGGLGPFQIECNRGGGFVAGIRGLTKESMEKMMNDLVSKGAAVVSNESFPAAPSK